MPACVTSLSSWDKKVLSIVKSHVSQYPVVSAAFQVGASLVSVLQARLGQSFYPSQTFSSCYITTMGWHQDSIEWAVLGLCE